MMTLKHRVLELEVAYDKVSKMVVDLQERVDELERDVAGINDVKIADLVRLGSTELLRKR